MNTIPQNTAEAIFRMAELGPLECMRRDEIAMGHKLLKPGDVHWFKPDDWRDTCLSRTGKTIRIVLVEARRPGRGAFSRLIRGIQRAKLTPVVLSPSDHLTAVLMKWGWTCRHVGEGFNAEEQWSPS